MLKPFANFYLIDEEDGIINVEDVPKTKDSLQNLRKQ
jgi:hypothetical protein